MQKGGTTALDRFLRKHPSLQLPHETKEIHFFDDETPDWSKPDYERLHAHFDWDRAGTFLCGEGTPITIFWPQALERLRAYNPHARLILALRHPTFRAFSHWRMGMVRNAETLSFEDAISATGRARLDAPKNSDAWRVYSYVERGFYAGQIEHLFTLFPREQIFIFRTDDLWTRAQETLDALQDFLGVERLLSPDRSYITHLSTARLGDIPEVPRRALDDMFRADIRATAALTGLNLSDWLSPAYAEPMIEPPAAGTKG